MSVIKSIQNLQANYSDIWHDISMEETVYVVYGPVDGVKSIIVDKDDSTMSKVLYVFKSVEAANVYAVRHGSQYFTGPVKLGILIEKLREVYKLESEYQVKCVLTVLNQEGILYELDILWQLFTH